MPDFNFMQPGIWGDEYRAAGGIVVPEYLEQMQQSQQQMDDLYGDYQTPEPEPQQSFMDPEQFVDWPTYQSIVGDKLKPHEAYEEYATIALPSQLRQMGYSDDEISQAIKQFPSLVAPPAPDYGFIGNLWESARSGLATGTRASEASGSLVTGNRDALAKLVAEQAGMGAVPAPLQRFQEALGEAENSSDWWEAFKAYPAAIVNEPQGAANWLTNLVGIMAPAIGGQLAGAGGGALIGSAVPGIGTLAGGIAGGMLGSGAGSLSVEAGSQFLERVADEAQRRNIDPRDEAAIKQLLSDPVLYEGIRDAAAIKGAVVAAGDMATAGISMKLGSAANAARKAGQGRRALGLGAGAVASELVGDPGFEALSQKAAGDDLNWTEIWGESFGGGLQGAASGGIGALIPSQQQATPGNATDIDLENFEDEELPPPPVPTLTGGLLANQNPTLAVGPEGGAFLPTPENIAARDRALRGQIGVEELGPVEEITIGDIPTEPPPGAGGIEVTEITPEEIQLGRGGMDVGELVAEEITLQPAQAVDSAELRIREGRLLPQLPPGRAGPPLVGGVPGVGTPEQMEELRLQGITTPQPADFNVNDPEALISWLGDRGVSLASEEQRAIVADLIGTRPNDRQAFIADAIEGLASSNEQGAEPLAQALLAISRSIPRERNTRARAQAALESVLPGVPVSEIPKVVASEAAQKVMDDLASGVVDAPTPPVAATPANPLAARRSRGRPAATSVLTPRQSERPIAAGEPLPTSGGLGGLVGQLVGPGPAGSNEAPVQQPRGGLRNRVNQEGAGRRGRQLNVGGGEGPAVGGDTRGAGAQPVGTAGAGGVSELAPPIKVQLSTERVPRMYGAQEEDVANKEALSEDRAAARAKKQTGGLAKKEVRERQRKIDAVVMDKAEYEKAYPGRNYDKDLEAINRATNISQDLRDPDTHDTYEKLSDDDLIGMQRRTASQNLEMLASRTRNPLARALAEYLATLDMPTILRLRNLNVPGKYVYQETPDGRVFNDAVLLDPYKPLGRTVEAVIHEYVHAATVHNYYSPKTEEQRTAVRKIDALYAYVKANVPESKAYGLDSPAEFIAEAFSNFEFQKLLNSVQVPETEVTLWTAFKELVKQLLGVSVKRGSAMHKLLLEIEPLFSAERGGLTQRGIQANMQSSTPANNARANAAPSSAILGTKDGARTFIAYAKSKNANTTYTLYPVTPQEYRGVKGAGLAGMTRDQVERHITRAGSSVVAPVTDTTVAKGTPKNSSTRQVGYDNAGNLQSAAFEQKDGTWTYYESDADVRTDPDARVTKGLSKDAVQRFITARGLAAEPPADGVKPAGSTPTSVGYKPSSWLRRAAQDEEATLEKIGGDVAVTGALRNSRVEKKIREANRQYVEPARKAGQRITESFGKKEDQIFELLQNMHVVERMQHKMQQFARGNLSPAEQATKQQDLLDKQNAAQKYVNDARASNPAYVQAVEQELAPKLRAMANNTIDMSAQYGLISRDTAENIKKAYDFYVPLQKDDKRTTVGKAATGASVTGDLTFPRMVEQMERTVARGEQNRVRAEVLKLVEQDVLINKDTNESPVTVGPKHVIRYNPDTNSLNTGEDSFVFDRDAVDVYRNGERIRMKIHDPSLLDALHPFKGNEERPAAVTMALATLARVNRIISIGKTSLNPAWPPFNFLRDVLTSNINLPTGVSRARYWAELANPKNYASVLWNVAKEAFGGEPAGGYADAKDAGAFISHRAFIGLDPIASSVQAMFKPPLAKFDKKHLYGLSQSGTRVGQAGAKLFEFLSIYPQWVESVPRMAMYKAARASGMSKDKAAYAAKNASVNFEKRGKANLSNYWIFGNAKMQGLTALLQAAQRQGILKSTGAAVSIIGLGAVAAAMGYEWSEKDKDGKSKYIKIPDFKKDSMLLVQANGYGVPLPQEIVPLYVMGNAFAEAIMGGISKSKAAARIVTAFMNNLWPGSVAQQDPVGHNANAADFITRMMLPSQIAPLYDTATNRNTFGREVVSGLKNKRDQGIPLSEMGSPNENQLAVNAAKGLYQATDGRVDIAPQQLKLWNNFFNPAAEGFAFWRDMFGGRESKYVGDIVHPIARKFTGAATEFYDQEQFDELLSKAKRAKYLAEQPGRGGISQLSPEDQVLARSAAMLEKVERDGNNLFKGQKLMTPERRALLNERKRDLVLGGIRRYNDMKDRAGVR